MGSAHSAHEDEQTYPVQRRQLNPKILQQQETLMMNQLEKIRVEKQNLQDDISEHDIRKTLVPIFLSSHTHTLYSLDPEAVYLDPTDPYFFTKTSLPPMQASEFVKQKAFTFFANVVEQHISNLIPLVFEGHFNTQQCLSFSTVQSALSNLYSGATLGSQAKTQKISIPLFKEGTLPFRQIEEFLITARDRLQKELKESGESFDQYANPEGSNPKQKDKIRDEASKKLGLTRATLQHLVKSGTDWDNWVKTHLLKPLINATIEVELQAFLAKGGASLSNLSDPIINQQSLANFDREIARIENLLSIRKSQPENEQSSFFPEYLYSSSDSENTTEKHPVFLSPQEDSPPAGVSPSFLSGIGHNYLYDPTRLFSSSSSSTQEPATSISDAEKTSSSVPSRNSPQPESISSPPSRHSSVSSTRSDSRDLDFTGNMSCKMM